MFDYEMLQERIREHGEQLRREAGAERLARQARGRRQGSRRRFAFDAAFGRFRGARGQAQLQDG
jgi:hypothetical protein